MQAGPPGDRDPRHRRHRRRARPAAADGGPVQPHPVQPVQERPDRRDRHPRPRRADPAVHPRADREADRGAAVRHRRPGHGRRRHRRADADRADVRAGPIQPETHAPPRLRLTWGHSGLSFKAIAETIDQKFVLFSPEGIPLRATLTMTFRGYATLEEQIADLKLAVRRPDQAARRHARGDPEPDRLGGARRSGSVAGAGRRQPRRRHPRARARHRPDHPADRLFGGVAQSSHDRPADLHRPGLLRPGFEMRLRGANVPRDVIRDVMQVSFKDSLTDVDSFDVTINNWDAGPRTFKYSDDYLFDPGTEIELWMGYRDSSLRLMITGEIVELRPVLPVRRPAHAGHPRAGPAAPAAQGAAVQGLGRENRHRDRPADRQRPRDHARPPVAGPAGPRAALRLPPPGQRLRHHLPAGPGPPDRIRPAGAGRPAPTVPSRTASCTSRRPRPSSGPPTS